MLSDFTKKTCAWIKQNKDKPVINAMGILLFDMENDAVEPINVSAEHPAVVTSLKKLLAAGTFRSPEGPVNHKKRIVVHGVILLVVSLPFAVIHLLAQPGDAPITPVQHVVAALANFFGPWGVVIVRGGDLSCRTASSHRPCPRSRPRTAPAGRCAVRR